MDKYQKLEKVGEGTYGVVYKAMCKDDGRIVALKRFQLNSADEGIPCTVIREIALLKDLAHITIIRIYDVIYGKKKMVIVFEYGGKDLKKYMEECGGRVSPVQARSFCYQMQRGIAYCHERYILHRDLKPQNILICENGDLKLADFGLARTFSVPIASYSKDVVTLWYRPPDVLMGSTKYGTSIDIWSAGCIFAEMVSGRPLFPSQNAKEQIIRIFKILGTPTLAIWPGMKDLPEYTPDLPMFPPRNLADYVPALDQQGLDLLIRMIRYNPDERISAANSLRHPYFDTMDKSRYI